MPDSPAETAVDGRRLRSERSRTAIIEAMVSLQNDGILVPTAQQVSERSGVNIRSLFRHFADMETLFEIADAHVRASYQAPFAGGNREGSLEERIERAVTQHSRAFEKLRNMMLSARVLHWRYEAIRKNYARGQALLRKDLEDWLPELRDLPNEAREVVDAIASFDLWHRLREHQGQGQKATVRIVAGLIAKQVRSHSRST